MAPSHCHDPFFLRNVFPLPDYGTSIAISSLHADCLTKCVKQFRLGIAINRLFEWQKPIDVAFNMRLLYDIMCVTTLWARAFDNKKIDSNKCGWRVAGEAAGLIRPSEESNG